MESLVTKKQNVLSKNNAWKGDESNFCINPQRFSINSVATVKSPLLVSKTDNFKEAENREPHISNNSSKNVISKQNDLTQIFPKKPEKSSKKTDSTFIARQAFNISEKTLAFFSQDNQSNPKSGKQINSSTSSSVITLSSDGRYDSTQNSEISAYQRKLAYNAKWKKNKRITNASQEKEPRKLRRIVLQSSSEEFSSALQSTLNSDGCISSPIYYEPQDENGEKQKLQREFWRNFMRKRRSNIVKRHADNKKRRENYTKRKLDPAFLYHCRTRRMISRTKSSMVKFFFRLSEIIRKNDRKMDAPIFVEWSNLTQEKIKKLQKKLKNCRNRRRNKLNHARVLLFRQLQQWKKIILKVQTICKNPIFATIKNERYEKHFDRFLEIMHSNRLTFASSDYEILKKLEKAESVNNDLEACRHAVLKALWKATTKLLEKTNDPKYYLPKKEESLAHKRMRQICRLRYHVKDNSEVTDFRYTFISMREGYPKLYNNYFFGNYPNMVNDQWNCDEIAYTEDVETEFEGLTDIQMKMNKETYIRLCRDDECPKLTDDEILGFDEILRKLISHLVQENWGAANDIFLENQNCLKNSNVLYFLEVFKGCYQGLRSIYIDLWKIRKYLKCLTDDCFLDYDQLPKEVKLIYLQITKRSIPEDYMTEKAILRRYAIEIEQFEKKEEDLENSECMCCQLLRNRSIVKPMAVTFNPFFLPVKYRHLKRVNVCRFCHTSLIKNQLPKDAVQNGFEIVEPPECFNGLNFVELVLIQRVKAVAHTFMVNDASGNRTSVLGKKGVVVFFPNPIQENLDYLEDNLPNENDLKAIIASEENSFRPVTVDFAKVFKCLNYLKNHNSHYQDIIISKSVIFDSEGNVSIKKQSGNPRKFIQRNPNDSLLCKVNVRAGLPTILANTKPGEKPSTAFQQYFLKKHPPRHVTIKNKNLMVLTFPNLFCDGRFGLSHPRTHSVSLSKFIQVHLQSVNRKFATNHSFVTTCTGMLEQQQLQEATFKIQHRVRGKYNAKEMKKMSNSKDVKKHVLFSSMLKSLKGCGPYWEKVKQSVVAHVQAFGKPTLWVTFNPNLKGWRQLHILYESIKCHPVDESNIYEEVARDPFIFSRFIRQRFRALMKFIESKNGPLGTVQHKFIRYEHTHFGLQHIHGFFWIKNAPNENSSEEEIIRWIDSKISVDLPDSELNPILFDLVNTVQRHHQPCTKTCEVLVDVNGVTRSYCRFEFPMPILAKTTLRTQLGSQLPRYRKRNYYQARNENEVNINAYNKPLMLAWKGNMDISWIGNSPSVIIDYFTTYAAKCPESVESSFYKYEHEEIREDQIFKIGVDLLSLREISMFQMIDLCMGHSAYEFDCDHTFINTEPSGERVRMLKDYKLIKNMADNEDPCHLSMADYYIDRPDSLEQCCYYNFCVYFGPEYYAKDKFGRQDLTKYAKSARGISYRDAENGERLIDGWIVLSETEEMDSAYKESPFYDAGYNVSKKDSPLFDHRYDIRRKERLKLRSKKGEIPKEIVKLAVPVVPQMYLQRPDEDDATSSERYYFKLCMLFIPFRDERNIKDFFLQNYKATWFKKWDAEKKAHSFWYQDVDKILKRFFQYYDEENVLFKSRPKKYKADCPYKQPPSPLDKICLNFDRGNFDIKEHFQNVQNLSDDQKKPFEYIINLNVIQKKGEDPMAKRVLILGPAGTGKSHFIKTLSNQLTLDYLEGNEEDRKHKPACIIAAFTGRAAINVGGLTCHKLFSLDITDKAFCELSNERVNVLRNQFANCRLLILDEVSMINAPTLFKIHLRCMQIMDCQQLFGNLNVLLTGDLLQLAPIDHGFCFEDIPRETLSKLFNMPSANLPFWQNLDLAYFELTSQHRQKADKEFGEMLNRIRIGIPSETDFEMLEDRIIDTNEFLTSFEAGLSRFHVLRTTINPTVIAIFATNKAVDKFNNEYLHSHFPDQIIEIKPVEMDKKDFEKFNDRDFDDESPYCFETGMLIDDIKDNLSKPAKKLQRTVRRRIFQKRRFKLKFDPKNKGKYRKNQNKRTVQKKPPNVCKTIFLSIGCRVKLKRNISVEERLVNGSRGTLLEYELEENGNQIAALIIQFDRHEKVTRITRSCFTIKRAHANDLHIWQFPICLNFASTIHSIQGENVECMIADLQLIFSPSMAYVILSRLYSLVGLHLMNCPKNVFYCNKKALREYNKLRESIGLVPYESDLTNDLTKTDEMCIFKTKMQQNVFSKPMEMMTENNQKIAFAHKKVLPFVNHNNDCFLIAAVNGCNSMRKLCELIFRYVRAKSEKCSKLITCLNSLLIGTCDDITVLRNEMHGFNQLGQHDANEALIYLLSAMDPRILMAVQFEHILLRSCKCTNKLNSGAAKSTAFFLSFSVLKTAREQTFENLKKQWNNQLESYFCEECYTTFEISQTANFGKYQRYLIVQLLRNDFNHSVFIQNFNADCEEFGNKKCKLIGAIEFISHINHYVFWQKNGREWIKVNDNSTETLQHLNAGLSNYTTLIFEFISSEFIPRFATTASSWDHRVCLRLPNQGENICYLNSAINIIESMTDVKEALLLNAQSSSEIQCKLVEVLQRRAMHARNIREIIPEFNNTEMKDAATALNKLCNAIDAETKKLFQFVFTRKKECSCSTVSRSTVENMVSLTVSHATPQSINDMITAWLTSYSRPCRKCNTRALCSRELTFQPDQKYLIIEFGTRENQSNNSLATTNLIQDYIEPFNLDNLTIFGRRMRALSMIEYNVNGLHYITWKRHENIWLKIDDDNISQVSDVLPYSNYTVFVFKLL